MEPRFPNLNIVEAFTILDNSGNCLFGKYYRSMENIGRKSYEESLYSEVRKQSGELIVVNNRFVVCRIHSDLIIYVTCVRGNELIVSILIDCFISSMGNVSRHPLEKRTVLESYDIVCLIVDEMIDEGVILEMDVDELMKKVPRRDSEISEGVVEHARVQIQSHFIQKARYWREQLTKP
jgi:coatomer subunit zeta